jgi:hypothetical protein
MEKVAPSVLACSSCDAFGHESAMLRRWGHKSYVCKVLRLDRRYMAMTRESYLCVAAWQS